MEDGTQQAPATPSPYGQYHPGEFRPGQSHQPVTEAMRGRASSLVGLAGPQQTRPPTSELQRPWRAFARFFTLDQAAALSRSR